MCWRRPAWRLRSLTQVGWVWCHCQVAHLKEIAQYLDDTRKQTSGAIGANFVVAYFNPATPRECVAAAASRANVVDFFYGDPDALLVKEAHAGGALAS